MVLFVAVHVSYLLAVWQGHVPGCNPYWDSCSSISAAGRQMPEFLWFKLTMIPAAGLIIVYWRQMSIWLQFLDIPHHSIRQSGQIAGVFLMLYVLALGIEGDVFRLQRRIGVILYFTLTYLAQLLLVARLWRHNHRAAPVRLMFVNCIVLLIIGSSSLFTDLLTEWHDDVEDAYEWTLALLLDFYFLVSYWAWRVTGFDGHNIKPAARA